MHIWAAHSQGFRSNKNQLDNTQQLEWESSAILPLLIGFLIIDWFLSAELEL